VWSDEKRHEERKHQHPTKVAKGTTPDIKLTKAPHEIGAFELTSNMLSSEIFRLRDRDDLTKKGVFRPEVLLENPSIQGISTSKACDLE